jgi:hypothetical protein
MSGYGADPFEAGQREALRATDALLDRIRSREPTPADLDDPLVAALALMAAEIDVDPVPVEVTRAALERELADACPGPVLRPLGPPDAVVDERTGLVLDLRDLPAPVGDPEARERMRRRLPTVAAAARAAERGSTLRRPRRQSRPEPASTSGAIAPPRSLPPTRPKGAEPRGRRERRLKPATAFVAVIAALILGTGVSAVVTGGRSVNPLDGLQQVVAQLTGGRTAEQSALFTKAQADLDAASGALDRGDRAAARVHLRDYDQLDLRVLTQVDQDSLHAHRVQLQQRLAR